MKVWDQAVEEWRGQRRLVVDAEPLEGISF